MIVFYLCFLHISRVLYFSVHRYEHGAFWPNLRESDFHYIGKGAGKGFNVNVPLNKTKMGNADYLAIWHQLLLPLAYEVIISFVLVLFNFIGIQTLSIFIA